MVEIKFYSGKIHEAKVDAIVVPCFEDEKQNEYLSLLGAAIVDEYSRLKKAKVFKGKFGSAYTISSLNRIEIPNIILVGLGKKEDFHIESLRRSVYIGHKKAKLLKVKSYLTLLNTVELPDTTFTVSEVTLLSNYVFDKYKNEEANKTVRSVLLFNQNKAAKVSAKELAEIKRAKIVAGATNYARDLVNTSPSEIYPEALAREARKLKSSDCKVTVYDEKGLKKLGCNAILAVGSGSSRKPRLIIVDYNPNGAKESLAIVGKGITFDSGGLNIKPGAYMETMKSDMSGAACALSVAKAAKELNIKKRIIAVLASAENLPSSTAYRPDDVIKTFSGKTIEIGNTDAEGRVVLCDALAFTEKRIKPQKIVDLATLTGACVVALGNYPSGMMTTDDELARGIHDAGEVTGDRVWRLPLWEEYKHLIKSDIADVKNIGKNGGAGTITAACFLQHFIEKTPWVHLDIAGTAFLKEAQWYKPKGGTGAGVRLLLEYIR